jgi:hypothetical protein
MVKRGFIRIDDDAQLGNIHELAEKLRSLGMVVTDISPVVGQITGSAEESRLPHINESAAEYGARFILEDDDVEHKLPDPGSDLQSTADEGSQDPSGQKI